MNVGKCNVRKRILAVTGALLIQGGILAAMMFVLPGGRAYDGGSIRKQTESMGIQAAGGEQGSPGRSVRDAGDAKDMKDAGDTKGTKDAEDSSGGAAKGDKEVRNIYKENGKDLILVNAEYGLDESYQASLRTICNGRLQASGRLYDSLVDMLAAASEEGYRYWIASAWRSRERQQKLVDEDVRLAMNKGMTYEQALKETYKETMPAGHSEHETGLALDILVEGNTVMDASQEKEPANIWLCKNSWRYGFVLRYPKGKEAVTGISYEPWHFRYVGKKAAAYMYKHDMTLEEFWERL